MRPVLSLSSGAVVSWLAMLRILNCAAT
jgi:hypothetical protein